MCEFVHKWVNERESCAFYLCIVCVRVCHTRFRRYRFCWLCSDDARRLCCCRAPGGRRGRSGVRGRRGCATKASLIYNALWQRLRVLRQAIVKKGSEILYKKREQNKHENKKQNGTHTKQTKQTKSSTKRQKRNHHTKSHTHTKQLNLYEMPAPLLSCFSDLMYDYHIVVAYY